MPKHDDSCSAYGNQSDKVIYWYTGLPFRPPNTEKNAFVKMMFFALKIHLKVSFVKASPSTLYYIKLSDNMC